MDTLGSDLIYLDCLPVYRAPMSRAEFSKQTKREAWLRCHDGQGLPRCEGCGQLFEGRRPEYDHKIAAELGGDNSLENCQCLCPKCHRAKTSFADIPRIAKNARIRDKRAGLRKTHWRWPRRKFTSAY
jgi:5-methylcytosine-specific restriction endonuclease McrA